ncbi:hypothetical protein Dsin_022155 [Dipteronia sinensis]|uniref:Agenet-like domain-containing protein n=1 Tax=Dipteronia sinensis TaxID=43782 RepID=A0AAE0A1F5_9ROSI|nr:hypothetical protein Dsin_022155 [Dipteronia sinensis]
MYEDKRGPKKVKVRWFHHNLELKGAVSLRNPHPKEVFITVHAQGNMEGEEILVRKVIGYDMWIDEPNTTVDSKALIPTDAAGNSTQTTIHKRKEEVEELTPDKNVKLGGKRIGQEKGSQGFMIDNPGNESGSGWKLMAYEPSYKKLKYGLSGMKLLSHKHIECQPWQGSMYKVDEKIELLCQDSGIRGCWFRCTVLQESRKQTKVRYNGVQDDDVCGNLEDKEEGTAVQTAAQPLRPKPRPFTKEVTGISHGPNRRPCLAVQTAI